MHAYLPNIPLPILTKIHFVKLSKIHSLLYKYWEVEPEGVIDLGKNHSSHKIYFQFLHCIIEPLSFINSYKLCWPLKSQVHQRLTSRTAARHG